VELVVLHRSASTFAGYAQLPAAVPPSSSARSVQSMSALSIACCIWHQFVIEVSRLVHRAEIQPSRSAT